MMVYEILHHVFVPSVFITTFCQVFTKELHDDIDYSELGSWYIIVVHVVSSWSFLWKVYIIATVCVEFLS